MKKSLIALSLVAGLVAGSAMALGQSGSGQSGMNPAGILAAKQHQANQAQTAPTTGLIIVGVTMPVNNGKLQNAATSSNAYYVCLSGSAQGTQNWYPSSPQTPLTSSITPGQGVSSTPVATCAQSTPVIMKADAAPVALPGKTATTVVNYTLFSNAS